MDITESSLKLPNTHSSLSHHHYNLTRSIFLKRSRHFYGHQYSRRNSAHQADGKGTPLRDERLSFKLGSQSNSDFGSYADNWEKVFNKPERIRSRYSVMDGISTEAVKMTCGICQKMLKQKPASLGSTLSSGDLSAVAVLVCGHIYHADCLERQTSHEDRRDPPCPMCVGLLSEVGTSGETNWWCNDRIGSRLWFWDH